MQVAPITKSIEREIRGLRQARVRRDSGLCLCEGARCCGDLLAARPELVKYAVVDESGKAADFAAAPLVYLAPPSRFKAFSATVNSQGVALVAATPPPPPPDEPSIGAYVLLLDRVADPGNLGTIIRTAGAAGVAEIWLVDGGADPFSDKALRSGMAAQFAVRLRRAASLDAAAAILRRLGRQSFFRTVPRGGASLFEIPDLYDNSVIVIGGEAHGAGELAGATAASIPMPGVVESLNVAQAATIIIFEAVRRSQ